MARVEHHSQPMRIVLDKKDFEALVRGQEIQQGGVKIILSDIGFAEMNTALYLAMRESRQK